MTTQPAGTLVFHIGSGQLEVLSGLLIGGPEAGLEAGGVDKTFIRNPSDGAPYIPGSSLKGKIRSLIEKQTNRPPRAVGRERRGFGAHSCQDLACPVCRLFGAGDVRDLVPERGPTRLLFRDAPFSDESRKAYQAALNESRRYFEVKTETGIDRKTSAALGGSLHTFERVPPGAKFDLQITLRELPGDDDVQALKNIVERGLKALEEDYLGSSGSRGYGKVKRLNWTWNQVAP